MAVTVARLQAVLGANTTQFDTAMGRAAAKMGGVGKAMTMGLTLPIAAVAAGSVKMAMDFEGTMGKIEGLVGASTADMDLYRASVLKLGGETSQKPKELAEALFFVTSAGFKGKDAMDVLRASAKAAAAGLGETKVVADAVTSAVNAYGIKNLSAAKATDVLTAAVREGKLEPAELAGTLGKVIPVAAEVGVSFADVGAALAGMSKTGLGAAEGATALRGLLMTFVKPTKEAEKALGALGYTAQSIRDKMGKQGLHATLMELRGAFEGSAGTLAKYIMEMAQAGQAGSFLGVSMKQLREEIKERGAEQAFLDLKGTFGDTQATMTKVIGNVRALGGFLSLTGDTAAENTKIFSALSQAAGDTDKAFAVAANTTEFKMRAAVANLQAAMITLGSVLLPMVAKIAESIGGLALRFQGLNSTQQKMILIVGGVIAVLGPLLIITASVINAFIALRVATLALNLALAANPIGLVVVGIAALAAGLVLAYQKSDTFRKIVDSLFAVLKKVGAFVADEFVAAFRSVADTVGQVVDTVKDLIGWLGKIKAPNLKFWEGDAFDPTMTHPGHASAFDLKGAHPVMAPFAASAAAHGLQVSSGLRPGAITASGKLSDHAVGKALDLVGSASAMASYFMSLIGNRAVKQAFFDPRGSIFGGAWSSYRQGGHSDHVHVATYDKGGWLPPRSKTLAINNTSQWEPVGPPGRAPVVNVYVGGSVVWERDLWDVVRREGIKFKRLNGSTGL